MLTFEEKQQIIETFPELTRKEVSMKRLNYHYEESLLDKTIVVQHLHPNGNGFVFLPDVPGYEADDRGLVNIREATEDEIKTMIQLSIELLSKEDEPIEEVWTDGKSDLWLKEETGYWSLYHGDNLEEGFGDYQEAVDYLEEEGFSLKGEVNEDER